MLPPLRGGGDGRTWEGSLDGKTHGQDRHERFVGHGVDDRPDYSLEIPSPGNPPVEQVGDSGVRKQPDGPGMVVVQDEVAYHGSGDEAREGQDVGEGVNVLVGRELFEGTKDGLLGIQGRFAGDSSVRSRSRKGGRKGGEGVTWLASDVSCALA